MLVLDHGESSHRLVKVPNDKVASWDDSHDALGRDLGGRAVGVSEESDSQRGGEDLKNGEKV